MRAPLEKYVHDHLAGAAFAIDLLDALGRKHKDDVFGPQLQILLVEISRDKQALAEMMEKLGVKQGGLKETLGRLLAKLSRPKLISSADDIFSSFEACETLALGILGKIALWDAVLAMGYGPWDKGNILTLKRRAEKQHAAMEKLRLDLATIALTHQTVADFQLR